MKKLVISMLCLLGMIQTASAQYKVGDTYEKDGLKGVVVSVDESGQHGLIMSVTGCSSRWCTGDVKLAVGATDTKDGMKNFEKVKTYIKKKNLTWDDFPLFKWANELGEGWYIPASDELMDIIKNINGGVLSYDSKKIKAISKAMKKLGGKSMVASGIAGSGNPYTMITSTEEGGDLVLQVCMNESASSVIGGPLAALGGLKTGKFALEPTPKKLGMGKMAGDYSRAVHKF